MTNVLPEEYRDSVTCRNRTRLFVFAGLVVAASACVGGLMILPSFLLVRTAMESPKPPTVPDEKQAAVERSEAAEMHAFLQALAPLKHDAQSASLFAALVALKSPGVSIERVTYSRENGFVVSGMAAGRDALSEYRTAVAKDARFSGVSIPVGALLGTESDHYTMTVQVSE